MAAETWQMTDPLRVHPDHPVTDDDSAEAVESAVDELSMGRSPANHGHAGLRLHVLASLIAQAEALIPDAVADAREHGFWWSEIADELGITEPTARRRYSSYARGRAPLPIEPD